MPRDGSGIFTKPFPDVVAGTTVESAVHNGIIADFTTDANAARPVVAGGTGATGAAGARTNLQTERARQEVTNFDSHVFESGSFWSGSPATGSPEAGHSYTGICHIHGDANFMTVEARDANDSVSPGRKFVRQKISGTWGFWQQEAESTSALDVKYVNVTGDTMTGSLGITTAAPIITLKCGPLNTDLAGIAFYRAATARWSLEGITAGNESGSNSGSNFTLNSFNDAGGPLRQNLYIDRATGAVTVQGSVSATSFGTAGSVTASTGSFSGGLQAVQLTIDGGAGNSVAFLNKTSGATAAFVAGRTAGVTRWQINMPHTGSENDTTGGDFVLARYHGAAATYMGAPFIVERASGDIRIGEPLSATPGFGNTVAGTLFKQSGTAYHSAAAATPLFINVGVDGYVQSIQRAGAQVGAISVTSTTTAFLSLSDERLKEDLQSFNAGNIIDDTKVYSFRWKETGERSYGMIAQQAATVFPGATSYSEDTDRWFMDNSKYVPVILQELQALRKRVAELEAQAGLRPTLPDSKPQ